MVVKRPTNHVTRALRGAAVVQPGAAFPEVDTTLLEYLEKSYPPMCYDPTPGETLERHLMYAGAVNLISVLRQAHDEQQKPDAGVDEFEDD
jgi:hypothetical protein